jgi:uncharacterized membrane-anchored protein
MRRAAFFILLIQTLLLIGMIGEKQWTLNTGTQVLLETQPIDPRSLFRGDYVRLNYSISRLNIDQLPGDNSFVEHDPVYLVLQPEEKYWAPVSIHKTCPEIQENQVVIKGTVEWVMEQIWDDELKKSVEANTIDVRYGIENYFVPEGEGMALERPQEGEKVDIRVAIDSRGKAGIKAVLVNGEERYIEKLF